MTICFVCCRVMDGFWSDEPPSWTDDSSTLSPSSESLDQVQPPELSEPTELFAPESPSPRLSPPPVLSKKQAERSKRAPSHCARTIRTRAMRRLEAERLSKGGFVMKFYNKEAREHPLEPFGETYVHQHPGLWVKWPDAAHINRSSALSRQHVHPDEPAGSHKTFP